MENLDDPRWNTLPEGPHSNINSFVSDRATAQALGNVNRFGRNHLSCATNCPPNHICYPKGEGCILGSETEGKEHCCEFDNNVPAPPPDEFTKAVVVMTTYAGANPSARSYTDPGFFRAFSRLFAPVLQRYSDATSRKFHVMNNTPHLRFNYALPSNAEEKLRLVQLGVKLFSTIMVHINEASTVRNINKSYRNNFNFFWDCKMTWTGNNEVDVPADYLCLARNLSIEAVNTDISEQHVFDMIVNKLNDTNDGRSNILVKIGYTQAGSADFSAITRACHRSSFKGRILCKISPQTQVTQGYFGSIGIYVQDNVHVDEMVQPPGWATSVMQGMPERVFIIEA